MMGTVSMNPVLDCPFATSDALLEGIEEKIIIMDMHAEATAEKCALAYYLDGRISAMFGTHTPMCRPPTSRSFRAVPAS